MENNTGDLDTLVQEKLDADTDFAESIADLSDEDKEQAIQTKKSEILSQEFKALKEKADKAEKAEELANNYKIRAEKAEKNKKDGFSNEDKTSKNDGDLSSKDILALTKANINDEDIDEVLDYAKYKKISVAEALKNGVVKTMLAEREEQRTIANAANTGAARRGSNIANDDTLISNTQAGNLPESDAEIERLAQARMRKMKGK